MLRGLKVINLDPKQQIHSNPSGEVFYLKTCQRQLIVGFNANPYKYLMAEDYCEWQGEKAYTFLLKTICGLKSRLLGENEIVSQFKGAFSFYLSRKDKNPYVIQVFEKLFKDAKEIRTKYLDRVGQLSYAGITKSSISHSVPEIRKKLKALVKHSACKCCPGSKEAMETSTLLSSTPSELRTPFSLAITSLLPGSETMP